MRGIEFMIKRAEYRRSKEADLFERVIRWAEEDGDEIVAEIVRRAYADDDAEHWLTIHPASSYTGLTGYYMDIVAEERELYGNERRLLAKRLAEYAQRLIDE